MTNLWDLPYPKLNYEKMAKTEHYYIKLIPGGIYHVYNRSIAGAQLFITAEDAQMFLKLYYSYLSPVLTTYSYGLCGNHFHFGVKIKSEEALEQFRILEGYKEDRFETEHDLVAEQFRCFFLSYAKRYNLQYQRDGALFQKPFKRCMITSEEKLIRMIFYHHENPQRHGICKDFRNYPWTSYVRYIKNQPSSLPKEEVFEMLGGYENFLKYHKLAHDMLVEDNEWFIEDDEDEWS
jgi:putative transposase